MWFSRDTGLMEDTSVEVAYVQGNPAASRIKGMGAGVFVGMGLWSAFGAGTSERRAQRPSLRGAYARLANKAVDKYRSPNDGMIVTISLPAFSGRRAT